MPKPNLIPKRNLSQTMPGIPKRCHSKLCQNLTLIPKRNLSQTMPNLGARNFGASLLQ